MLDEISIERQLQREKTFSPKFCPKPICQNHFPDRASKNFYKIHGWKRLKRFPYQSRRFQCKDCRTTFCYSLFHLHYRQKVWGANEKIWDFHQLGVSRRETARRINRSEKLVRVRLRNMARFAELKHNQWSEKMTILEPIVFDGLENFSFSQFDPNNINHAVGKKSLFVYDFNFSPINRKGRMSPAQVIKKRKLELKHGKYPVDSIRQSTRKIFKRLFAKSAGDLTLYTDRHYQYRRVVEEDLRDCKITHLKVSSKIHRNFRNDLFAVNNIDLQARHNLAAFKRETIAFSKHEVAMQDAFCLYIIYRNYMRPKFWGTHRSDPLSAVKSPAMELGITKKILSFKEFFRDRVLPTQTNLHEDARDRYDRKSPTTRRVIAAAPAI